MNDDGEDGALDVALRLFLPGKSGEKLGPARENNSSFISEVRTKSSITDEKTGVDYFTEWCWPRYL